jgi:hypothetical protein
VLDKFLETLYNKVFVNIVVEGTKTNVYMEICSGGTQLEMLDNAHATFETDSLNAKMLEFIESYTRESPYFYISVLDNSLSQGVIPTCEKNRLSYYHDVSASEYKCMDEKWTYFTSKTDLYAIEKKYQKIGVDFIFSPFSVLSHFFKDKIDSVLAMYILVEDATISVAVFDNGELLFGDQLDMHHIVEAEGLSSSDLDEDISLDEEGINLEDIDVDGDEMDSIDDFADIEDLDALEEIDEFAEYKDIEEELYEAAQDPDSSSHEVEFNEDYRRFVLIQSSIGNYYKDKKYESRFIENVYIADNIGTSSELKKYLEEEMFLNVYVRQADVSMEVCELTKMEFDV